MTSSDPTDRISEETGTRYDATGEPEQTPHDELLEEGDKDVTANVASSSDAETDQEHEQLHDQP